MTALMIVLSVLFLLTASLFLLGLCRVASEADKQSDADA